MREKKNCIQKNDLFQEIFEKVTPADEMILGSLVYAAEYVCGRFFLLADGLRADAGRCFKR